MIGEYKHTIDNKGRIFIPSKFREELGDVLFITISPEKCLLLYSENDWNAFSDKANILPFSKQQKLRPLFSKASRCVIDSQGRALIPNGLRKWANLYKEVSIVGNNNHAELWDSSLWENMIANETSPDNVYSALEEFNF